MIWQEVKKLKTGRSELRKFGLLVGGVFVLLGLFFLVRGKAFYPFVLAPGLVLVVLGVIVPRSLKHVYLGWMSLALGLGFVVSHVVLTLFFFLVMTPIGLAARCLGKDFLRLRLDRQAPTYWVRRDSRAAKQPTDYEHQF